MECTANSTQLSVSWSLRSASDVSDCLARAVEEISSYTLELPQQLTHDRNATVTVPHQVDKRWTFVEKVLWVCRLTAFLCRKTQVVIHMSWRWKIQHYHLWPWITPSRYLRTFTSLMANNNNNYYCFCSLALTQSVTLLCFLDHRKPANTQVHFSLKPLQHFDLCTLYIIIHGLL